ncbi:hypothetical protein [Ekhidna sp.]|uniref:hypothetical protein n=1 Tax=Ekhidna sp. TaxID=2608089 RepID=UPI003B50FC02
MKLTHYPFYIGTNSLLVILSCIILCSSCTEDDPPCSEVTWYEDNDSDGLGNPNVSQDSCEQPEGYVANDDDPDDSNGDKNGGNLFINLGGHPGAYRGEPTSVSIEIRATHGFKSLQMNGEEIEEVNEGDTSQNLSIMLNTEIDYGRAEFIFTLEDQLGRETSSTWLLQIIKDFPTNSPLMVSNYEVMLEDIGQPNHLLLVDTDLYISETYYTPSFSLSSRILRTDINTFGSVETLIAGLDWPDFIPLGMVIHNDHFYYADQASLEVRKVPRDNFSMAPEVVLNGQNYDHLLLAGDLLYYSTFDAIGTIDLANNTNTDNIFSNNEYSQNAMILVGTTMYVTNSWNGYLYSFDVSNPDNKTVLVEGFYQPLGMVLYGDYLLISDDVGNRIIAVEIGSGSYEATVLTDQVDGPMGMVIHDGYLYVAERFPNIVSRFYLEP